MQSISSGKEDKLEHIAKGGQFPIFINELFQICSALADKRDAKAIRKTDFRPMRQ